MKYRLLISGKYHFGGYNTLREAQRAKEKLKGDIEIQEYIDGKTRIISNHDGIQMGYVSY